MFKDCYRRFNIGFISKFLILLFGRRGCRLWGWSQGRQACRHVVTFFWANGKGDLRIGEQGWRSGKRARLPPMCPGFDSWAQRHMWIEFVVGSRPFSEGFSQGSLVFLPPQKPKFLNSNSIGNSRATGLSVEDCCVSPSLNNVDWLIYFI